MSVKKIPDGYSTVTPYLVVANAAKLNRFSQGRASAPRRPFRHPALPNGDVSFDKAEVRIGTSALMLGGAGPDHKPMPAMFYLYVEDSDALYKRAVAAGATEKYPMTTQFYGDRSGTVTDGWGNSWTVSTHVEDVSPEELDKRAQAAYAKHKSS